MGVSSFSERAPIATPASHAFDVLADPATAPVIDPAIRSYRPDTHPMGVGTRNEIRMRLWGLPVRATSAVVAWEPGRRMVMASVRPSRPVRVVATHAFDGDGDACTYTWAVEVVPVGVLGRAAAPVVARALRRNAVAQQPRFRREAERRWTDGGA